MTHVGKMEEHLISLGSDCEKTPTLCFIQSSVACSLVKYPSSCSPLSLFQIPFNYILSSLYFRDISFLMESNHRFHFKISGIITPEKFIASRVNFSVLCQQLQISLFLTSLCMQSVIKALVYRCFILHHNINTFKYHVFAPMGKFQLGLIYLYSPPSFHQTVSCFCPVGLSWL